MKKSKPKPRRSVYLLLVFGSLAHVFGVFSSFVKAQRRLAELSDYDRARTHVVRFVIDKRY